MSNFTVQYFIDRISAIPDDQWCVGTFTNPDQPTQHCVYGHLNCVEENDENEEANALDRLFRRHGLIATAVNDGDGSAAAGIFNTIATPKARILAALESF